MLAGMRQVVQCKLQPGQLNCAPPSRRWCHRAAPTRHQRATGVITSPHTRQRSERTNDIAHAPFWRVHAIHLEGECELRAMGPIEWDSIVTDALFRFSRVLIR